MIINMIKDYIRQMCAPLENSVYFGDGDGFNSNFVYGVIEPGTELSKYWFR